MFEFTPTTDLVKRHKELIRKKRTLTAAIKETEKPYVLLRAQNLAVERREKYKGILSYVKHELRSIDQELHSRHATKPTVHATSARGEAGGSTPLSAGSKSMRKK